MLPIYGRDCAYLAGQSEMEGKFNGWLSSKLFCIFNEVSTSAHERRAVKNRLKALITDKYFTIEEKFMPSRMEENHANFVFLSNERQPVSADADDRRHTVIDFNTEQPKEYYEALALEINSGGLESFFAYLLAYDIGDFNAYTKPYYTEARKELIELSLSAQEDFINTWMEGELPYPFGAATADDLFTAFRIWCKENEIRNVPSKKTLGSYLKKRIRQERFRIGGQRPRCWIPDESVGDEKAQIERFHSILTVERERYAKEGI
jgi:hypothetical protein